MNFGSMYFRGSGEADVNKFLYMLLKVAKMDEVRERRSDPSFRDFHRYVVDTKFILANLKQKCKVLDIGAGAGVFSIVLAQMGFDVTAADIAVEDESEIIFFKKFGCKFVSLNLGEKTIPFQNAQFDAVLCLHVLEHLKKPRAGLMEMKRVLRRGGVLVLMTPNGLLTSFYNRLRPLKCRGGPQHVKEYAMNELLSMLKFYGFEVCNVGYSNEMMSVSLIDATTLKKLFGYLYLFLCKLFPIFSYEIHLAARAY